MEIRVLSIGVLHLSVDMLLEGEANRYAPLYNPFQTTCSRWYYVLYNSGCLLLADVQYLVSISMDDVHGDNDAVWMMMVIRAIPNSYPMVGCRSAWMRALLGNHCRNSVRIDGEQLVLDVGMVITVKYLLYAWYPQTTTFKKMEGAATRSQTHLHNGIL